MPNLTQAHTVRGEKGTMNEKKKDISDKKKRRHTSVLRLLPFGEVWRLKSHLLVFSDGSRPAVR